MWRLPTPHTSTNTMTAGGGTWHLSSYSWRPHWEGLLTSLAGSIPQDWQVLVMADRGLYARWLFQAICTCGWHPFLRINLGVKARDVEEECFDWISR
jgi:hypothetical protein